ncbi:aminotransferase class V-fold PLP-dependent enzyme [Fulvivirga lutea]|uniref:Aminotransferase class V-fold PLP-dependent enzyme n=1 Tax=Fulvivirga lutea TaxID=2810512 RepID=A0A975A1U4_9BACT|nr:aminotransferase class V-fold PLP-dependent enzyme [Fulvivirga lutea]QSE98201.1 aminotransferase class V-fold PLP-dependent enzyme [Fulvivirga lutea]
MDIDLLRNETPGCSQVIHFNNAGAALVSKRTLQAQINCLKEEANYGSYETAANYSEQLSEFYNEVATLINASPNEIAFTESATVAWLRSFYAIGFKEGDEIICDQSSYASNYIAFLNAQNKFGVKIKIASEGKEGEVSLDDIEKLISDKTKLISITHIPTNNGLVNPAENIGDLASEKGILYQLDACQSAGQYPLDVKKLKCDFLSATGRKYMRGPRGTGFLYVKQEVIERFNPLNLDLHSAEWIDKTTFKARSDAKKFETWEHSIAGKLGLTEATRQINELGISNIWDRVVDVATYLRVELSQLEGIEVTDTGSLKSGIVTFQVPDKSHEEIKAHLSRHKFNTVIAVKSGTLIDMSSRNLDSVIRASIHYYNTNSEIDSFVSCLRNYLHSE